MIIHPADSFTVLGSSSGMPQPDRANAGYCLKIGDDLTLVDCGGGVTSSFIRCGFDPLAVSRVVISHTHPDHCGDLPLFIQATYLAGRKTPLDLYLPEDFVEPFAAYMRAVYLIVEKLPFTVNLIPYMAGEVFDYPCRLTAYANRHLQGYAELVEKLGLPNRLRCYSLGVETENKSLLYSADIAGFADIADLINGRDFAVIEATHLDLNELFEALPGSGTRQVVLTHLGSSEEIDRLKQKINKSGRDNIIVAEDGLILPL
ncbi:MAG TPA: MBL fold metallo-hydrolase [candidate division Zixibacteria bacterium]|nr:MBL fold metallo-hydrolase [candidate division Zixibacteria bacterium]